MFISIQLLIIWVLLYEVAGAGISRKSVEKIITDNTLSADMTDSAERWVITDIHYISPGLTDYGSCFSCLLDEANGKNLLIIDDLMSGFLQEIAWKKPKALIITGDLTFNGATISHQDFSLWLSDIESLGTEVYVIPGNHDILNPWARCFKGEGSCRTSTITPEQFSNIYRDYGYDQAVSRDSASLSYLIEPVAGLQVLMLDSCNYDQNLSTCVPEAEGSLSRETRAWIKECALSARNKDFRIIAAMHHSLIQHDPGFDTGFTVNDSEELYSFFSGLGIRTFLTGHTHFQDIVEKDSPEGPVLDISTNALSVYPHDYGVLKQEKDDWTYESISLVNDRNIFEEPFSDQAENFFRETCSRMVGAVLSNNTYDEDEREEICSVFDTVCLNFFSGTEYRNTEDIDPHVLERCLTDAPVSVSSYISGKIEDPTYDQFCRF